MIWDTSPAPPVCLACLSDIRAATEMAQAMAGLLAEMGYDVDLATNGRQAFASATQSPDYDFILLHFNLAGRKLTTC